MTALMKRYGRPVAVFAVVTVAPVVLLSLVAVAIGLVRTAALLGFGLLVLLRVGFLGLQRLGDACPGPRFIPAPVSESGGVR